MKSKKKNVFLPIGRVRVPIDAVTNEQFLDWVRIVIGKEPYFSCGDEQRGRKKK